jgi:hypothetical protein
MLRLLRLLPIISAGFFRSRRNLVLENLALRQQLAVLIQTQPQPRFAVLDKQFWVVPGWLEAGIDRAPLYDGIGQGSRCIGRGFHGIEFLQ